MLSVTNPISVQRLRDGLRREFNFRNFSSSGRLNLRVPPVSVLRAFLADHPEFLVDERGLVRPATPLDYRVELGETDKVLVDVFRSSPSMVLDRSSVLTGCLERGVNLSTAGTDLTYSCVVEHLDTNIWTLRGADVNPAAVEALRQANAIRPKERRVREFGWTPEGRLWVAVVVPPVVQTAVFGCPAGAKDFLRGQRFSVATEDGLACGIIGITEDASVYGLNKFLSISGADEGDLMVVEFDLVHQTATALLGDEELLDRYGEA
jgi:hypothetical protein